MNFDKEFTKRREQIDQMIRQYLPKEEGYQKKVLEAMNYSMLSGGKRIRAMLMLESFRLFCNEDHDVIKPFIAAMEMIHTYSLVHDDLPAMDNDEYRRGRKTTHVEYGEAMGILAGDGLLGYAYETACKAFQLDFDLKKIAEAIQVLAEKPGIYGMLGGQAVDIEATDQQVDLEKLTFIYHLKTGALVEGSMLIGAILGGAKAEELPIVESIAKDVGFAFQIQDDILDVTSTFETLGKPILSDEKNHKTTYVTLVGIEKAKQDVEQISNRALENLNKLNHENEYLKELILSLIVREK